MMTQMIIGPVIFQSSMADLDNGIGIAVVGMVTVFIGLVCLAFLLPLLENWVDRRIRREGDEELHDDSSGGERRMTSEEVAAVSAAIHAHFCLLDQVENMKLTWETYEKPFTPWRLAGKAELLQESGSLHKRIRSR
jgi:Na+-transporting methylmalonyl-CoA/oxaloacetate decarboxylase gamma subunit